MRQIGSAALDAERKSVMTLQTMLSLNINALDQYEGVKADERYRRRWGRDDIYCWSRAYDILPNRDVNRKQRR